VKQMEAREQELKKELEAREQKGSQKKTF